MLSTTDNPSDTQETDLQDDSHDQQKDLNDRDVGQKFLGIIKQAHSRIKDTTGCF